MNKRKLNSAIKDFRTDQKNITNSMLIKEGQLRPLISILCWDEEKQKFGAVIAPIVGDFNEDTKQLLVDEIIPQIFEQISEKELKPVCMAFSSEVWVRKGEKGMSIEQIKKLERKEAVVTIFETMTSSDIVAFSIERDGSAINEDGQMIDNIKLEPYEMAEGMPGSDPVIGGRLTGLFKKYASE